MFKKLRRLDNNPDILRERAKDFMRRREWDRARRYLDRSLDDKNNEYLDDEEGGPNKVVSFGFDNYKLSADAALKYFCLVALNMNELIYLD